MYHTDVDFVLHSAAELIRVRLIIMTSSVHDYSGSGTALPNLINIILLQ